MCSILEFENCKVYWETHSGSGLYTFDFQEAQQAQRWWKLEYGLFHLLKSFHSNTLKFIPNSTFLKLISKHLISEEGNLLYSPGSPWLATQILLGSSGDPSQKELIFCDIDPRSLESIEQVNLQFQVPKEMKMKLMLKDGLATINKELDQSLRKEETILFLDPYDIFALDSETQTINSLMVFEKSITLGIKTLLWYGFDSTQDRTLKLEALKKIKQGKNSATNNIYAQTKITYTEIIFAEIDNMKLNPGVKGGCVLVCANLSPQTMSLVLQLGKELETIYENTTFPDSSSGKIFFHSIEI